MVSIFLFFSYIINESIFALSFKCCLKRHLVLLGGSKKKGYPPFKNCIGFINVLFPTTDWMCPLLIRRTLKTLLVQREEIDFQNSSSADEDDTESGFAFRGVQPVPVTFSEKAGRFSVCDRGFARRRVKQLIFQWSRVYDQLCEQQTRFPVARSAALSPPFPSPTAVPRAAHRWRWRPSPWDHLISVWRHCWWRHSRPYNTCFYIFFIFWDFIFVKFI